MHNHPERWCPWRIARRALPVIFVAWLALAAPGNAQQQGDVIPGGGVVVPPEPPGALSPAAPQRDRPANATEALFAAVAVNDLPAVQLAVGAGANIDARNRWGLSPIDIAIDKGFYQIAHFLLSIRNSDPPATTREGTGTAAGGGAPAPFFATPMPAAPAPAASGLAAALPPPPADDSRYAWPEGEPNPFDPAVPAPGAELPVIGEIRVP